MDETYETLVIADIKILTNRACFLQKKGDKTPRGRNTPTEGKEKTNIKDDSSMLLRLLNTPLDIKKVNPASILLMYLTLRFLKRLHLLQQNSFHEAKYFQVLSKVGLDVTNLSYIKNMLKSSAEETSVLVEEVSEGAK